MICMLDIFSVFEKQRKFDVVNYFACKYQHDHYQLATHSILLFFPPFGIPLYHTVIPYTILCMYYVYDVIVKTCLVHSHPSLMLYDLLMYPSRQ